ncbi:LacI family DNA-binding transcriptional regulator [Streptomyces sp. GLT-R25]
MTRKTTGDIAGRRTIRDVAARAGVSASTVSRVLGGDYPVSTSTRTRVMRAVRDLDYVADARAKAIAGAGTPTLAFVLDDITEARPSRTWRTAWSARRPGSAICPSCAARTATPNASWSSSR